MGRFEDEGNILVSNQSKNVLVNYNFMLRVEGIYDLPCKAVHSFTKENEFEYVQEGGLNDYVHMLRKPVSKPFSFTVERYVGMDIVPPLPLGAELILPLILMVAPNANQFGNAKRTFVFTGCTVMSKTFGELNAEKSELLTETIVIGYREMTEVTVPVHAGSDGPLWEFDGVNVNGNSVKSARSLADNGAAVQRQWLVGKGDNVSSVQSAKKYTDIFKQEETQGDSAEVNIRKSNIKQSPDTGEAKKRQWLPEGEESAKKYTDIFKQEEEQKEEETLEKKPTVKKGPDTGKAEVRKTGMKKGTDTGEAEVRKTGMKKGSDTGDADKRQWITEEGNSTGGVQSAKQAPDTGDVKVRRWPPTRSAATLTETKK